MFLTKRCCLRLLGLLLLGLVPACASEPYREEDPGPYSLSTRPPEARVLIGTLELYTPCHLPEGVSPDDEIEISKPGFVTFRGPLRDLNRVGINSYDLTLRPQR